MMEDDVDDEEEDDDDDDSEDLCGHTSHGRCSAHM